MNLFDNYLKDLNDVLSKKVELSSEFLKEQRSFSQALNKSNQSDSLNEGAIQTPSIIEGPKVLFNYDKRFLLEKFGENVHLFDGITIGPHPDFEDLEETSYLNHHCVSVFVDIKGSTALIGKYSLLEVRLIKDSLLTLSINVANQFGGHVHRLQGDGIFLQFVRRDKNDNDAIINALNASSILTQFVTTDLAKIMNDFELKPLKIRVGLDYGKTDDVLWSYYGLPGCNELTTTSLHTDMAAKLQAKAYDNHILIGGNVRDKLDLKIDFYNVYESETTKEKDYYISKHFSYKFYVFNWQKYLLSLPFFGKNSDGRTLEIRERNIQIKCFVSDESGLNTEEYFPNSRSIPKEYKIVFKLYSGNLEYIKRDFDNIEWFAFNSGLQAEEQEMLEHDFGKKFHGKVFCETSAAYLGHHYVECKITRNHSGTEKFTFPIFVR